LDVKKKVWEDKYIEYGYSGADDEKLVVIVFTARRVSIHSMASRVPEVLVAEPIQYDKDLQMMHSLSEMDIPVHLTTVDENGVLHSRLVNTVVFHPVLGFFIGSHFRGKKTKHLAHNSHAVISTYKDSTGDCFTIEADIVVQNEKQFLLATWKPFLAG
jgi:general stress protein 26